jgi:hypothetical protein
MFAKPQNTEVGVGQSKPIVYDFWQDNVFNAETSKSITVYDLDNSRLVYVREAQRLAFLLSVHDFMELLVQYWQLSDETLVDLVATWMSEYNLMLGDSPIDYILRVRKLWTPNRIGDIQTAKLIALLNRMAPYNIMQALMLGQRSSLTTQVLYPMYERVMAEAEATHTPYVRTTTRTEENSEYPYAPWYVTYNYKVETELRTMTILCGSELEAKEVAASHRFGTSLKIASHANFKPRKRHNEREWTFLCADVVSSNAGRLRQLLVDCGGKITLVYKRSARTDGDVRRGLLVFAPLVVHPRQGITDITAELEGLVGVQVYNRRTNEGIIETGIVIPRASGESYETALSNNLTSVATSVSAVFDGAAEITISVLS